MNKNSVRTCGLKDRCSLTWVTFRQGFQEVNNTPILTLNRLWVVLQLWGWNTRYIFRCESEVFHGHCRLLRLTAAATRQHSVPLITGWCVKLTKKTQTYRNTQKVEVWTLFNGTSQNSLQIFGRYCRHRDKWADIYIYNKKTVKICKTLSECKWITSSLTEIKLGFELSNTKATSTKRVAVIIAPIMPLLLLWLLLLLAMMGMGVLLGIFACVQSLLKNVGSFSFAL